MLLLLIATGAVYVVLGSVKEAAALGVSILVVVGITLYQEAKTERTLQALRDLSSPRALVIRDGHRKRIAGREVVRGDLLVLSEGDRVAADALVLSEVNLTAEESLLTGESVPVLKAVWDGHSEVPRPGGDNVPAVFSGTLIVKGSGTAVVTSTGPRTEIGRLGSVLGTIEPERTRLESETGSLVRLFAIVSIVLCGVVALVYGLTRDAVVLAASVHAGEHESEMVRFVKKHVVQLDHLPTAFLSVTLSEAGAERKDASAQEHAAFEADVNKMLRPFL
jgi:Ca2+-transporting ATPase